MPIKTTSIISSGGASQQYPQLSWQAWIYHCRDELLPVFNGEEKVWGLKQSKTSCGPNAFVTRNWTHSQYLMTFFLIRKNKAEKSWVCLKATSRCCNETWRIVQQNAMQSKSRLRICLSLPLTRPSQTTRFQFLCGLKSFQGPYSLNLSIKFLIHVWPEHLELSDGAIKHLLKFSIIYNFNFNPSI